MHLVKNEATSCGRQNECPVVRLHGFMSKVHIVENGCWEWQGFRTPHFGHGEFTWAKGRTTKAHIASYRMFIGEVPDSLFVLHRCDNPPCVNPTHLFIGTQADNITDKVAKGRQARNEQHGMAKLTDQQISEIRHLRSSGVINAELARMFSVSPTHIGRIIKGTHRVLSQNAPI